MTTAAATRASTLALAGALAGGVLLFSQSFSLCFPPPRWLALPLFAGLAATALGAAGGWPAAFRLPFAAPLLAALAWGAAGMARSESPEALGLVFTPLAAAAVAALVAGVLAARPAERARLLLAFVLAHLACGLYGIVQYLGADPWTWTLDYGRGRVFATLGNPNFLAGQLALALPVLAALGVSSGSRPPDQVLRWLARAAFVAALAAFICAQTRGAWIGLAAGSVVAAAAAWQHVHARPAAIAWLVAVVAVLGLVFSVRTFNPTGISLPAQLASSTNLDQQSARQRFFWWRAAAELVRAGPVLGQGLGNFAREFPARARRALGPFSDLPPAFCDHPHDDYLFVLCEHGVIGLGLLLWLGSVWARLAWRAARGGDALGTGLLAGIVALAVHAVWNMPFTIQGTLVTAGVLLGLSAAPRPAGTAEAPLPSARGRALWLGLGLAATLAVSWRPVVLLAAQAYYNGARILHDSRQEAPAAFCARQTLRLTNAPWRTHFLLGSVLYANQYWEAAREAFAADEAENPWGADSILHQGKTLRELGRWGEADAQCRRALKLVPNYADAATAIATLAYARARTERAAGRLAPMRAQLRHARVWLTYALRYFPRHAEALKLLGFTEVMDSRWIAARDAWTRSLRARPTDDALRAQLGLLEADLPRLLRGGRPREGKGQ
ncbi:MAG: O-antigen ligase family protein [Candidatus Coatesbacteria bacterium]